MMKSLRRWFAKLKAPWGHVGRMRVLAYAEPPFGKIVHRAILMKQ